MRVYISLLFCSLIRKIRFRSLIVIGRVGQGFGWDGGINSKK